ncbi:RNA pol II accessory factor, Cdc73 family-domain-containing protein [Gongronella butleri]|nr:RNA pol II accessory factor, Cdc73 family-domain-containing protein [Gongronella butleri]
MASPLTLLRDFTIQNKPIELLNDKNEPVEAMRECAYIKFGDATFARGTDSTLNKGSDGTYALDTLVFLLVHAQSDNSVYFRECREHKVDHVSIVDKRKILDYLTGKVNDIPNQTAVKRPHEEEQKPEQEEKKAKIGQDTKDIVNRITAREHELETRNSILQGSKAFEKLGEQVKVLLFNKSSRHHASQNDATTQQPSSRATKLSSEDKIPIIIVPAAPTAKLNLFNIKEFLQNEKYMDAQEIRASGEKKPEQVSVERRRANGQTAVYHVVDSVTGFKAADWDRVCCVVTTGQQWQFKGWKWEKPLDVFHNVLGFYPKWTSDKMGGTASDWNVRVLNIHRDRRYMDKAAVVDFWKKLDAFNSNRKPFLNY